jgi:uncharacterized protein YneF (UPF0154 family)
MQNTIVIATLTLITGFALGYFMRARKTANEQKACEPERERNEAEKKEEEVKAAAL